MSSLLNVLIEGPLDCSVFKCPTGTLQSTVTILFQAIYGRQEQLTTVIGLVVHSVSKERSEGC